MPAPPDSRAPASPHVSIITPTAGRTAFLPALAQCVRSQQLPCEWLVLDDSPTPDAWMQAQAAQDARIRYWHSPEHLTIGAKRNQLIAAARGELIAHFDDDDHYAPGYLAGMVRVLTQQRADLIKLSGFFVYMPGEEFLGYMDLNARTGWHYVLTRGAVDMVRFHEKMQIGADFILFYGFSFVYRRSLYPAIRFEDVDRDEDAGFMRRVVNAGHSAIAVNDAHHQCLHLVHPDSTSRCFARHSLPPFMRQELFPGYAGYPLATNQPSPVMDTTHTG